MALEAASVILHATNIVLTLGLLYVYAQNYAKLRSKYTMGLIIFAVFFLLQSGMGLYFDATMVMYSSPEAANSAMLLEALKAIGFAVLLKLSWE